MQISENSVVNFHYTLTNQAGDVLDTSDGREPLAYLHGHGQIISGLESHMVGKAAGDAFKAEIAPEDGYGVRSEEAVQEVPRDVFANIPDLTIGMQLHGETENGPMAVTVVDVSDSHVTIDGNHPLAGETLYFDVKIDSVRAATESELAHGHAHPGDGHHHH